MEAIAFVLAVLLIIASRIISRQVDVIVELRKKYDHAQSEIRALVLPGSIDHDAQKRRGKK